MKIELTEEEQKDYLKTDLCVCPYCDADDVRGGHNDFNSETFAIEAEYYCEKCGAEWVVKYTATSFDETQAPEEAKEESDEA